MARTLGEPQSPSPAQCHVGKGHTLRVSSRLHCQYLFWNAKRPTKRESDYFSAAPADSITCCLLSPERKFGTSVLGAASNKIHHSSWRRKTKLKMAREFASLMLLNEKAKAEPTTGPGCFCACAARCSPPRCRAA